MGDPADTKQDDVPTNVTSTVENLGSVSTRSGDEPTTGAPDTISMICGYVDDQGILYDRAQVQEMGGAEEDLLANKKVPMRNRLEGIIAGCITKLLPSKEDAARGARPIVGKKEIEYAVARFPVVDRPYSLVQIRVMGAGPIFKYRATCPRVPGCQATHWYQTDLTKLGVTHPEDRRARQYNVQLKHGRIATMKIMLGVDEEVLEELSETTGNLLTSRLYVRCASMNGKPPIFAEMVGLKTSDRNTLRTQIVLREGDFETEVTHPCKSCGKNLTLDLAIGSEDFFFPTAM